MCSLHNSIEMHQDTLIEQSPILTGWSHKCMPVIGNVVDCIINLLPGAYPPLGNQGSCLSKNNKHTPEHLFSKDRKKFRMGVWLGEAPLYW